MSPTRTESILPQGNPIIQLIIAGARQRGLDPRAILAVARTEGGLVNRAGDIGDLAGGGSYGPFQLYAQGALPRRFVGNQQAADAWAWSPAGISYALDQIAQVARGLRGQAAINAIVRKFERPADPAGQIAKAAGLYRSSTVSPAPASPSALAPTSVARGALANPVLESIFAANSQALGLPPLPPAYQPPTPQPTVAPAPLTSPPRPPRTAKPLSFLKQFVAPFGVTITSTTGGKHVKGSYHYKARAVDLSGSPDKMMALARAALQQPQLFREMFYGPAGFYIKNGRVYKGDIGGHDDHVHLAR